MILTLAEMKLHLRVETDVTADDDLITSLIEAATRWCETFQHRKYLTQTVVESFDGFPMWFVPVWSPISAVQSIQYVDMDGTTQTVDSASYALETVNEPARITTAWGCSWPACRPQANAVTLTYTAGYGAAADVPDQVKQAAKLLVGDWYANREDSVEISLGKIPRGVEALLWQNRVLTI